ncbi:MAG: CPXCG motif-containing cysteine-rich protein [Pseudomonadota bacterium]
MHNTVEEKRLLCPACNASISVLIDSSAGSQSYIEDCEVCCRPLTISFVVDDEGISNVRADYAD